jgi:hypothetical protein
MHSVEKQILIEQRARMAIGKWPVEIGIGPLAKLSTIPKR